MKFKDHVATCTGNKGTEMTLKLKDSIPYCPHLQKNKTYAYMWCKGLEEHYKVCTDYFTFDFETVEEHIQGRTKERGTNIVARIRPYTVAATIDKNITIYFDKRNPKNFIHEFIATLFKYAKRVSESNVYQPIPGVSKEVMDRINYYAKSDEIPVLGFNSAKSDMQLFLEHLECDEWSIDRTSCLCTSTNMKMVKVKMNDDSQSVCLVFKDILNFQSPGTLETHAKDFGGVENTKSHMAYEAYDISNVDNILSRTVFFTREEFHSELKKHDYTAAEYKEALTCWYRAIRARACVLVCMRSDQRLSSPLNSLLTLWDYLEYYNKRDVQIMRPMIDNLIRNMWADKVDMLRNFSLSANASALKYAMAYEDFDINADYSSEE
jgi:hypothetical protein